MFCSDYFSAFQLDLYSVDQADNKGIHCVCVYIFLKSKAISQCNYGQSCNAIFHHVIGFSFILVKMASQPHEYY